MIIQIIPAQDWYALYRRSEDKSIIPISLVCWALMDTANNRYVSPYVMNDKGSTIPANEYVPEPGYKYEKCEMLIKEAEVIYTGDEENDDGDDGNSNNIKLN